MGRGHRDPFGRAGRGRRGRRGGAERRTPAADRRGRASAGGDPRRSEGLARRAQGRRARRLPAGRDRPEAATDLVDLSTVHPRLRFDIRYAGADNFMGFALYERAGAWLQRPAAEAVGRAQAALEPLGYGLLIHDAYRPWFVTKMFWDAVPANARDYVADPSKGSRHNRGCAVDLTLYELKTGRAVEMPGRYDEFSRRSHPDYPGGTDRQRWHRDLLRRTMEAEGFAVYPEEWWHFDCADFQQYAIGADTFDALAKR
ncbi:MAG TPA: M15 family metallopeptidase [Caulobacteraceae bacterium]|nr:M15 family metallopeptidase [Caulobacteraceae bacterium]